jgi:alpha-glucosidase
MNKDWLWWKHGVIYQIYPRSFYDTSGDGIGDIPGIHAKLDYLQDLGIDGIWLSPINRSPMYDFGYDISDYRAIDPIFGSNEKFEKFIREARKRNIHILMDLVMNHSSHLHPWFLDARSSRSNPKRDWYIWHDGRKGKYPNNWYASFGGRAWEWDQLTGQYYLHTFLKEQPDLNWRNPQLKQAMFGEIRYWLDRGVDGFRLDVVNWFIKDDKFRNNPFGIGPYPRPYDLQKHIYDRNRPEVHHLLNEFRELLDSYSQRMSVGEVFVEKPGNVQLAAEYLGNGDDELHLSFDFTMLYSRWGAKQYKKTVDTWMSLIPEKGWPCHVLGNHDQPRTMSRLGGDAEAERRSRVLAALLLTLKGTPFMYYGDEIGMKNGKIKRGQLMDPVGKKYWPLHPGRDPERTPMQWDSTAFAGFSQKEPWLPVNPDYKRVNVKAQQNDRGSLLSWYRDLLHLRKNSMVLSMGSWKPVDNPGRDIYAYYRWYDGKTNLVILNFANKSRRAMIRNEEPAPWKVLLSTHRGKGEVIAEMPLLAPYEATIMEMM